MEGSQRLSKDTSIGSVEHCAPLPDSADGSQNLTDGSEHTHPQNGELASASNSSRQTSFFFLPTSAQSGYAPPWIGGLYLDFINYLVADLPHLKIVTEEQLSRQSSITILTAPKGSNPVTDGRLEQHGPLYQEDEDKDGTGSLWNRTYESIADDTSLRLFVVEDLSPPIIEILGSTFRPNPEVFAEHLNNSQYKPGNYLDVNPSTDWPTRGLSKQWSSIRWWRPVRSQESLNDRRSLIENKEYAWKTARSCSEERPTSFWLGPRSRLWRC